MLYNVVGQPFLSGWHLVEPAEPDTIQVLDSVWHPVYMMVLLHQILLLVALLRQVLLLVYHSKQPIQLLFTLSPSNAQISQRSDLLTDHLYISQGIASHSPLWYTILFSTCSQPMQVYSKHSPRPNSNSPAHILDIPQPKKHQMKTRGEERICQVRY